MKSHLRKRWHKPLNRPSQELCEFCGDELIADILVNHGIHTIAQAKYYLPECEVAETEATEIPGLEKACQLITSAISQQQKITIYGDYDVDGTTSTALLHKALEELKAQELDYYIPHRFREGYGLNPQTVRNLRERGTDLLITCDCGITNIDEIQLANELGMKVIVTDHHSLPDKLPPAEAVLNPKQLASDHPLHWLPGVGVVYKLAQKLIGVASAEKLLDFVALGMIADLAPLRAENRLLTRRGLKVLARTRRVGLRALLRENNCSLDEEAVGFAIAPRINAAGRLAEALDAVKLFLTEDETLASTLSKQLSSQNQQRQKLCQDIYDEAVNEIENNYDVTQERVLMIAKEGWHHGVVGIVASRLVEKYNLPVFMGVLDNQQVKGSARGIKALDLFEEMNSQAELFERFGGHKMAAGFSMTEQNWQKFHQQLKDTLKDKLKPDDLQATLSLSAVLSTDQMKADNLKKIFRLAPFGFGFPKPVFSLIDGAEFVRAQPIGRQGLHHKIWLRLMNGQIIETILWRHNYELNLISGQKIWPAFVVSERDGALQFELRDWCTPLSTKEFLSKLLRHCRLLTKHKNAKFDLEKMAAQLNINKKSCHEGLKVLHNSGILDYQKEEIEVFAKAKRTHLDTSSLKRELEKHGLTTIF